MPVLHRHGGHPFYTVIPTHRSLSRLLRHAGDTQDKVEAIKHVYVSQVYEGISSDEDFEPEFVKVKMEEPVDKWKMTIDNGQDKMEEI